MHQKFSLHTLLQKKPFFLAAIHFTLWWLIAALLFAFEEYTHWKCKQTPHSAKNSRNVLQQNVISLSMRIFAGGPYSEHISWPLPIPLVTINRNKSDYSTQGSSNGHCHGRGCPFPICTICQPLLLPLYWCRINGLAFLVLLTSQLF